MGGLSGGVLIGSDRITEPERAEPRGHLGADRGALAFRQGAIDVAGQLRAGLIVGRGTRTGRVKSGELAGGEDRLGGVPVGLVAGLPGFRVRAEDLARVVGRDLELLAAWRVPGCEEIPELSSSAQIRGNRGWPDN